MNGAVLQVLLILGFLAIGLISVTFPIYAISVNFLPQQKWEDEKGRKKRMDNLKAKISQLTDELKGESQDVKRVTELEEQMTNYKNELESTELRYQYLTAKGAVGIPVSLLIISLFFACFGTYAFYKDSREGVVVLGGFSAVFSIWAIYRLYKTISAVEYGALRPGRTVEFNAGFDEKNEKRISIQLSETAHHRFFVETPESEVENLYMQANFPAELGVEKLDTPANIIISEYENYTVICKTAEYLPKGRGTGFGFIVTPKKRGEYTVKALVYAKGIYEYSEDLTIEVV